MYRSKKAVGRRLAFVLVALAIIFVVFPKTASAAVGDFTIDLSSSTPSSGSTITASMSVDVDVNILATYDITWQFDPAVLQVAQVQPGTSTGFTSITNSRIDNDNGELQLVHFTTDETTGVINFALITFNVVGAGASSTTFTLTVTDLTDPNSDQIAEGTRGLVGPATVTVATLPPGSLVLTSTPSANIEAGSTVTLTAELKDTAGNHLNFTGLTELNFALVTGEGALGTANLELDGTISIDFTTANQVGSATISGTLEADANINASIILDTVAGPGHHLTISPPAASLKKGVSQTFTIQLQDQNNNKVDITTESLAQLTLDLNPEQGSLGTAAIVSGDVTVIYTAPADVPQDTTVTLSVSMAGGVTGASAIITLLAKELVSLSITAATTTVIATRSVQLTATGTFDDASQEDLTATVTWNSSVSTVGSFIVAGGAFVGIAPGTTNVTASANLITSNSITMTVNALVATSIELTATPPTGVVAGGQVTLTATIKDAEGTKIDVENAGDVSFTILSGGGALGANAVVNGDVQVVLTTSTTAGDAVVRASAGLLAQQDLTITTVAGEAHHLTISPATAIVKKGASQTFTIQLQDANNNKVAFTELSILDLIQTLDPAGRGSLEAAALVSGDATVVYTAPVDVTDQTQNAVTLSASMAGLTGAQATITLQPKALVSIAISEVQGRTTVQAGFSLEFEAVGTFDDETTADITQTVQWTSSNPDVAQFALFGHLIAMAAGSVNVTAAATEGTSVITSNALPITVTAAEDLTVTTQNNQTSFRVGSTLKVSFTGGGDREHIMGRIMRGGVFIAQLTFDADGNAEVPLTSLLLGENYAGKYQIIVFDGNLGIEKTIDFSIPVDIVPKGGVFFLGVPIDFQAFGTTDALVWEHTEITGTGIATINVNELNSRLMQVTTQGQGSFTVKATSQTNAVEVNGTTSVISIIAGGMVDVTVTNAADVSAILGASVSVFGMPVEPVTTDANGVAMFAGLPIGRNLVILVSAEGFSSAKVSRDVNGQFIKASTTAPSQVEVALTPSALTIGGNVVDLSGIGVASASVNLSGTLGDSITAFSATTNASAGGAFSFGLPEGAAGGTFKLVASAPGYGNSAVVTLPSVTDNITDVELMLSIFMTSRENPTTRVTTVRIFDMSGQLDGTATVDFVGTAPNGVLSAIVQVGASSQLGVDTPAHLSFTYTPGVGDVEGQISVRISHANLPGGSVDFSFIIHPVVQVGDKIATATTRVDVDAAAGGSIGIGTVDTDGDGVDDTQDNSEVILPPNAVIDAQGNAVAAITVRLSRTEGAAGAASAVYNVDIIDPLTGLEIPLRKVNIQQVPPEERIIIRIQIDPAIFDLAAFESGQLVVQYTDSAGDVFKNDGTFVATVEGNTIVIESSHASGWSVGAPDAPTSEAGGGGSSGGCFIATATSGSPLESEGQNLRDSGGSNLMSNGLSRWLVNQYHWYSRALADLMTQ